MFLLVLALGLARAGRRSSHFSRRRSSKADGPHRIARSEGGVRLDCGNMCTLTHMKLIPNWRSRSRPPSVSSAGTLEEKLRLLEELGYIF